MLLLSKETSKAQVKRRDKNSIRLKYIYPTYPTSMTKDTVRKEKISITIDKKLLASIDDECDETRKRSPVIESYIRKGMAVKELEKQVKTLRKKIESKRFDYV